MKLPLSRDITDVSLRHENSIRNYFKLVTS